MLLQLKADGTKTCIQCKDYKDTKVTSTKIDMWVSEIAAFPFTMQLFVIAVVSKPDVNLINHVAIISQERVVQGRCPVIIIFWDVLERFVKGNPNILALYYPMLAHCVAQTQPMTNYPNLILSETELRLRFLDAVSQYHIIDFLESNPFVRIDFDLLLDVDSFTYSVSDLLNKSMAIEATDRFIQIRDFMNALNEYNGYLSSICALAGNGLVHFMHEYGDMNSCKKIADEMLNKVYKYFREIKEC